MMSERHIEGKRPETKRPECLSLSQFERELWRGIVVARAGAGATIHIAVDDAEDAIDRYREYEGRMGA